MWQGRLRGATGVAECDGTAKIFVKHKYIKNKNFYVNSPFSWISSAWVLVEKYLFARTIAQASCEFIWFIRLYLVF